MIETNFNSHVRFSDLPIGTAAMSLANYLPTGVLTEDTIEYRKTTTWGYKSPWQVATLAEYNRTTNTLTLSTTDITNYEVRRQTPRYSVVFDPEHPKTRVSARTLQANADQGVFVATDYARQFGFDPYNPVITPTVLDLPGLATYTRNHHGPDADYTRKEWQFQFAGGYLAREHVRVVARANGVWVPVTLSYLDPGETGIPDASPHRFIGPFTLRLDLSLLAQPITGLVIYRHTPRNVHVPSPADAERLDAEDIDDGASHAVLVAAEIGEQLAWDSWFCRERWSWCPPDTLVPYNTSWDYQVIAFHADPGNTNLTPPVGGWTFNAPAPFGNNSGQWDPYPRFNTYWGFHTILWTRKTVFVPPFSAYEVEVFVENSVVVFANGVEIGSFNKANVDVNVGQGGVIADIPMVGYVEFHAKTSDEANATSDSQSLTLFQLRLNGTCT